MATQSKGKAARVVFLTVGGIIVAGAGTVSAVASKYQPLVAPNVKVAGIEVGGLTKDAASEKLSNWWREQADKELTIAAKGLTENPEGWTPRSLGVELDSEATLAKLPTEDFWANSARKLGALPKPGVNVEPVVNFDKSAVETIGQFVRGHLPERTTAKADYVAGKIVRTPEQTSLELDSQALDHVLVKSVLEGGPVELPLVKAKQRVSDDDLAKITDVVSEFTSHFSEGNENRAANIHNAARRLTGTVIMPGETFSFNKTLGQRTAKNGFKLAGVYNNGKHDFDIGGGICQISGTLYNATLLANLKIVQRSCHTFPVPYLPVGRDATVSFPNPDFAFKNSSDTPIAIAADAHGGTLTFRVLGVKDPSLEVKVVTEGHSTWSRGEKVIIDKSLAPGKRVIEEKGGPGHRINTYRLVYRDGKQVEREDLGQSYYNGGPRIVRFNPAPATGPIEEVPGKPVDDESPGAGNPIVPPAEHRAVKPAKPKASQNQRPDPASGIRP